MQAIRHSKWLCTGTSEIARCFGDGNFAAFTRVERAISRIAIRGSSQDFVGVTHEEYRGVRAGFYNRSSAHGVIVLSRHPILGCNRRIAKQLPKSVVRVDLSKLVVAAIADPARSGWSPCFTRVQRRFFGERFRWNFPGNRTASEQFKTCFKQ